MWLNWTPSWSTYSWWSTYNDGWISPSLFENQAFAQIDLDSKIVSLDYCDPNDLEVR